MNHRGVWGEIWQHQQREVGRKVLWERGTASAFIFCHLALMFRVSDRGTHAVPESYGGVCRR